MAERRRVGARQSDIDDDFGSESVPLLQSGGDNDSPTPTESSNDETRCVISNWSFFVLFHSLVSRHNTECRDSEVELWTLLTNRTQLRILFCSVKPWESFFILHCSSSLSCINVYLAIDSGGYLYEQSSSINYSMAGWFSEKLMCLIEQVCQCKAL